MRKAILTKIPCLVVASLFFCFASYPSSVSAQDEDSHEEKVIAHYKCVQQKIVAVSTSPKSFEPLMDAEIPGSDEWTPREFTVDVVEKKPDVRCATNFFDDSPFFKWEACYAKYTIAFDGYKDRPRSYSLAGLSSDDARSFYGSYGKYFSAPDVMNHYMTIYRDEGDQYMEVGTCEK